MLPTRVARRIAEGAIFQPGDPPDAFDELLGSVYERRLDTLVVLRLKLPALTSGEREVADFTDQVDAFLARPTGERRRVVADTAFLIWLRGTADAAAALAHGAADTWSEFTRLLDDFPNVVVRALDTTNASPRRLSCGMHLRRFDVDPYLVAAAPPTYDFSHAGADRAAAALAYPLGFFLEVCETALARIASAWPAAASELPRFVRSIVHVPDGDFRSASAARYTGTTFLTADDATVLDVEESIVHEFGHQLLYHLMEIDQLVLPEDQDDSYVLPWSGSERDFYGFFHAFYIYILLARYYRRLLEVSREVSRSESRLDEILTGLSQAIPVAREPERYTDLGATFSRSLQDEATRLLGAHV